MKSIFKLILFAVIVLFGLKWLDENGVSISNRLQPIWGWMDEQKEILKKEFLSLENESFNDIKEEKLSPDNMVRYNYPQTDNFTSAKDNSNSSASNHSSYADQGSSASHVSTSSYTSSDEAQESLVQSDRRNQTSENMVVDADLDWIKRITKKYSPNSWKLLQLYENLPGSISAKSADGGILSSNKSCDTYHYVEPGSILKLMKSMATNVHELAHAYFSLNAYNYANQRNMPLIIEYMRIQDLINICY